MLGEKGEQCWREIQGNPIRDLTDGVGIRNEVREFGGEKKFAGM